MARKAQFDAFDVRERFAADPLGCIRNLAAKRILREQDFGWRPWARLPLADRRAGTVVVAPARWEEKFWESLRGYLQELLDVRLASRFADFLVGYLLVVENETGGRELRPLRHIIGSPPSGRPQHAESLKQVLSRTMVDDLVASGFTRTSACEEVLPKIWETIEVKMKPASILRMERRSRKRTSETA